MERRKTIMISVGYAVVFSGILSMVSWFLIFSGYQSEESKWYPFIVFTFLFIAQTIWSYVSIKRRMK